MLIEILLSFLVIISLLIYFELRKIKETLKTNQSNIAKPLDEAAFNELYSKAKEIVIKENSASASLLQRRLSIGYANAARIMDKMEAEGVVSSANGAEPRKVLNS